MVSNILGSADSRTRRFPFGRKLAWNILDGRLQAGPRRTCIQAKSPGQLSFAGSVTYCHTFLVTSPHRQGRLSGRIKCKATCKPTKPCKWWKWSWLHHSKLYRLGKPGQGTCWSKHINTWSEYRQWSADTVGRTARFLPTPENSKEWVGCWAWWTAVSLNNMPFGRKRQKSSLHWHCWADKSQLGQHYWADQWQLGQHCSENWSWRSVIYQTKQKPQKCAGE